MFLDAWIDQDMFDIQWESRLLAQLEQDVGDHRQALGRGVVEDEFVDVEAGRGQRPLDQRGAEAATTEQCRPHRANSSDPLLLGES